MNAAATVDGCLDENDVDARAGRWRKLGGKRGLDDGGVCRSHAAAAALCSHTKHRPDKSCWRRYICLPTERKMAAVDEDDRPKKKLVHEIGQDLALLSVEEINDRILLLNDEVARLQDALAKKRASRSAADQFFKR